MSDDELYTKIAAEMGVASGGASSHGYHSIAEYLSCPKKYQYGKVRQLKKPVSAVPDYFAVGQLLHAGRAMFLYWGSAGTPEVQEAVRRSIVKAAEESPLPIRDSAVKQALRYMEEYAEHWSVRPKPRTLATEYLLDAPVFAERFTARLDDVSFYSEASGALAIGECKSTSGDISACIEQYKLHPQPIIQQYLWKAAANGEAVHGAVTGTVLDVIQKGWGGAPCKFARVFLQWDQELVKKVALFLAEKAAVARRIGWDDEVDRNFHSCTEMAGTARIACTYRPLCMEGRDAATQFITEDGVYLTAHAPSDEKRKMPWE
jgi:hypothetical protein